MLSIRPLPLRSGGGRSGIFCRRLFQHHKCKLFGMSERPNKGRKVPKNAIFMCDVKTYISTSYLVWFQTIFTIFFELSSIQRKFWLIISYLQGYGTVVPVSLLVSPIRPTERFRNRVFIKALYAWWWAVHRPTCVSEFDTKYRFRLIHRGSAMTLRCLYLLGKMLQKGAEIWSSQKHLYQQVSRRSYKQVFRKITKIPILKSANSWYPVI